MSPGKMEKSASGEIQGYSLFDQSSSPPGTPCRVLLLQGQKLSVTDYLRDRSSRIASGAREEKAADAPVQSVSVKEDEALPAKVTPNRPLQPHER